MSADAFPGLFESNWRKLSTYLQEAGKDPATYPTIAYHNVNINPDGNAALGESKRFLDEYYGPVFAPPMVEGWTAAVWDGLMPAAPAVRMFRVVRSA
jgi:hypothetical protein